MSKPSERDIRTTVETLMKYAAPKMRIVMLSQIMQVSGNMTGTSEMELLAASDLLARILRKKLTVAQLAMADALAPDDALLGEIMSKLDKPVGL